MAITTTTNIAGPVNVVFQMEALRQAKAVCPYFIGSESAEIAEHSGTFTAKWRRYENLTPTTTPLSELTGALVFPTRTETTPTVTDITATVQKYGTFIYLTEEVDLINFNQHGEQISTVLGIQAGRSLNRLQRNELEDSLTAILLGATTATSISGGSTASSNIKNSDIQAVVNTLDRNDAMRFRPLTEGSRNIGTAPVRESYWLLTHSDAEQDIRMITGFQGVEIYAGQTQTESGEFGAIGGVRCISTTEATIDAGIGTAGTGSATVHGRAATSGRTDVYNTVVIGKYCHGSLGLGFEHVKDIYRAGDKMPGVQIIRHAKGSAGAADPLNEVSSVGWKAWHAPKVLNGDWGRVIRHTVDRLQSNE